MTWRTRDMLLSLALMIAVLFVYWNVQRYEFLRFDEELYVTKNAHVLAPLSWAKIRWAFTAMDAGIWHPLTWLSLMLDHELYGLYAGGYHWTNVVLHGLGTVLLFMALRRMTARAGGSFVVALLFGIHPLHVESVAWVAERKDVLSGLFWMAALWFYGAYVEQGGWWRYLLVLASFVLGLLSKPMAVTLPFVLLLLDYWPLRRLEIGCGHSEEAGLVSKGTQRKRPSWLLLEKVPFFLLSAFFSLLAFHAQNYAGAVLPLESLPFSTRIGNALISYNRYLGKTFWPSDLAVFYPYPTVRPFLQIAAAFIFLVLVTAMVLYWRRRYPYLLVGWFWYVGTLIPVIGLVQVGSQSMADRYTYIPLVGVFMMFAWGFYAVRKKWPQGKAVLVSAAAVLAVFLVVAAHQQVQYWQNSVSLFSHAVSVAKQNYVAHNNLGAALMDRHDYDGAARHFARVLEIKPESIGAENDLGGALFKLGRIDDALVHYREAIRKNPEYADAERNLADALTAKGDVQEAVEHYRRALALQPKNPEAHNNLGVALFHLGDQEAAVRHIEEALRLRPDYGDALKNRDMLSRHRNNH